MKLLLTMMLALSLPALGYVHRNEADQHFPSQAAMEFQVIPVPAAASSTAVLAATNNPSTSTALVVTSSITNPDVPRNVTVTTGGTTGDCAAGNVVVSGTDYFGHSITESLAITNAQNGATTGAKAFQSVTSISLPAEQSTHSCTFALGIGSKLGLKRCLDQAGYLAWSTFGGAFETTHSTVAANATAVSQNTVSLNSAVDGAHDVGVFFVQNFRCLP